MSTQSASMRRSFTVFLLDPDCAGLTKAKATALGKSHKQGRGHPDSSIGAVSIEGLTQEEVISIQNLSLNTRQSIYSDLSQLHAWNYPLSGFPLIEKYVECVRRILDRKDIPSVLELPKDPADDPSYRHSGKQIVYKVFISVMETVARNSDTDRKFGTRVKAKGAIKPVCFRTFWDDGFLIYRKMVHACSRAEGVNYKTAIEHCYIIGRTIAKTKNNMRLVIEAWELSYYGSVDSDDDEQIDDLEDFVEHATDANGEDLTYDEWYARHVQVDQTDPEYQIDPKEFYKVIKRVAIHEKKRKKVARKRKSKNVTRQPKKTKQTKKNSQAKKKKEIDEEETSVNSNGTTLDPDAVVPVHDRVPLFHPNHCFSPNDEWLVLEIPYSSDEDMILGGNQVLIRGPTFVPEGSTGVKWVVFIKITGCFVYSFERADIVYHGQVQGQEKAKIEGRCSTQNIPFMSVTPKETLWLLAGVNVCDSSSPTYHSHFSGLRLDAKKIRKCLYENSKKGDADRGTIQTTLGVSTQNYECHAKTVEELEERPLDAPAWSGTDAVFDSLGPEVCDVIDRLQDFVDDVYRKPKRQQTSQLRFDLFAARLNEKLGCKRNRHEATTIAFALIDPRTNVLIRHIDKFNCTRLGHTVTAIWSCVYEDFAEEGEKILVRLSVIVYNRVQAGNYHDRLASYVTVFQSRIQYLLSLDHYSHAKDFKDLDLAAAFREGRFSEENVWYSQTIQTGEATLTCLVSPMYFDPCAYLSVFAWCITRLREKLSLSRIQVVELVHLSSCQSSALPFVWLTEQVLRDDLKYCKDELAKYGASRFYHEMICKKSGRISGSGGKYSRHQTCLRHHPGMVSSDDKIFTIESIEDHNKQMAELNKIIADVSDPLMNLTGKQAVTKMRECIRFLGDLNVLKVLPLSALVGLFDVQTCFADVLYGVCPKNEPHGMELAKLGCNTQHLQDQYIKGLNNSLGQPREYFFHGDHVLCMAQGVHLHPDREKVDVFFPEMPLMTFAENGSTICVIRKEYGCKDWVPHEPHLWATDGKDN